MISTSMQTPSGALPAVPTPCSAQQTPSGRAWAPQHLPNINEVERLSLKARTRFTWRITDRGAAPLTQECRMADTVSNPFEWCVRKQHELEDDWRWPIQSNLMLRSNNR
ncbi:MAG: hypothetical protein OQK24_07420 [Magnetovibrio sp.]|nr:hypothetical protein [Magnetovibrio sp.]